MDHQHGPEASLSDEADHLYQSLGGLEPWAALEVDRAAWSGAVERLRALRRDDLDRAGMVERGAMLAAAHRSAALDGLYGADRAFDIALVRGEASLASMDEAVRAHVRANVDALTFARDATVSEASIRRTHELACRPQLTHRVLVEDRLQDHVMAAGDYKHHPNHLRTAGGRWRQTAPVAQVSTEMAHLVAVAAGGQFAGLHPVVQAAWLHHALLHVQPFADGNGRVARALASGCLLRAASVPLLVLDGHDASTPHAVLHAVVALVHLVEGAGEAALEAWRARSAAADDLRARLVPALEQALRRDAPARRADVSRATVDADLVVRVPGVDVEEVLVIDAHPLEGGPLSVAAREAGLRLVAGDPLEPWLDRVVSVLALRVAAETE